MEKEQISIIVFLILTLGTAILFHYKNKKVLVSSLLTAIVVSILFQIIEYFILGYLDPFFLIAFASTLAISFIISLFVGLPFVYFRNKENE